MFDVRSSRSDASDGHIDSVEFGAGPSKARLALVERGRNSTTLGLVIAWSVLAAFLTLTTGNFLSVDNLLNVARASAIFGIAALGLTVALIAGALDVSFGAVMSLAGVITAQQIEAGRGPAVAISAGIAVGIVLGLVNAAIVLLLKMDPLIATLGTLSIFGGYAFMRTSGGPVAAQDPTLARIGRGDVLGVPIVVVALLVTALGLTVILRRTTFGQHCYITGDNAVAAGLARTPTKRTFVVALAISGSTAALAGIMLVGNAGIANPGTGERYLLAGIAAVVLGGTALTGGSGSIGGTLLGIAILGTIDNGLNLLEVSSFWQDTLRGLMLLLALFVDHWRRVRAS